MKSLSSLLLILALATQNNQVVVINEIAWMGTKSSHNDEWIELYNNSPSEIDISGWELKTQDKTLAILQGKIPAQGFFLLERTDDETLPDIKADQIYKGALKNTGENLLLLKGMEIIDQVDCSEAWFAGDNISKKTMERIDPLVDGNNPDNWQTGGSPKQANIIIPKEENADNNRVVLPEQKENPSLPILPICLSLSLFSGAIILILKKKIRQNLV